MTVAHPTEGLIDFPHIVDLLQAAGAVAETGHSGDVSRAQAACRAVSVGVGDAQILGYRGVDTVGIVDTLEHARVADARLVIHGRANRAAVADHGLLARNHDAARTAGTCADCRLGPV